MTFFTELTIEQQREVLTNAKAQLTIELSGILLRNGIDPVTFDPSTLDTIEWENTGDQFRATKVAQGIQIADQRLTAIA